MGLNIHKTPRIISADTETVKPRLQVRTLADILEKTEEPRESYKDRVVSITKILNPTGKIGGVVFDDTCPCEHEGCDDDATCFCLRDDRYTNMCDEHAYMYYIDYSRIFKSPEECADWICHMREKSWFSIARFMEVLKRFHDESYIEKNEQLIRNMFEYLRTQL